jgi:hypothetical protein
MARFEDTCRTNEDTLKAIFKNGKSGDKKEYIMFNRPTPGMYTKDFTYTINIVDSVDKTIDNGFCRFKFTGTYNGSGDPPAKNNLLTQTTKSVQNETQFFTFLNKHFSEKKLLTSQSESAIQAPVKQAQVKQAWGNESGKTVNRPAAAAATRPVSAPAAAQGKKTEPIITAAEAANKAAAAAKQKAAALAKQEAAKQKAAEAAKQEAAKQEAAKQKAAAAAKQEAEKADKLEAETAALVAEKEREIKAAADKVTYVSKFMTLLDDATKANKTETIKIMTTYKRNNPNIFNITNKTIPVKELSTQNSKLQELIIRVEELMRIQTHYHQRHPKIARPRPRR